MTATTVREAILREIENLPEAKQADVLVFIRFLRVGLVDEQTVERRFTDALTRGRAIARDRGITERDISEEVQAARSQS
jgi:hypothetical protein